MSNNAHLPYGHLLRDMSIAIIGGGPAGLTLARLLQMRGVEVTVFERDASPAARSQGGSLDLHEGSGQKALRAAGLEQFFLRAARRDGQNTRIFDKDGTQLIELDAESEERSRPEIDRGDLRNLLLNSLKPGTVEWDKRLLEVRQAEEGSSTLRFENDVVSADLIIGCDGPWSKVRHLVSEITAPAYTGVVFVQTIIKDVDSRYPEITRLVGPGNILVLHAGKGLLAQRNGDGSVRIYVALKAAEKWPEISGLREASPADARKALLPLFDGWSPQMVGLLRCSDDWFQPWPLYAYPADQMWMPHHRVTLLGDAAHIMPPFTGQGANFAMLDALELADALTSGQAASLGAALTEFEYGMLSRMEEAVAETLGTQELMFSDDSPASLLNTIKGG